MATDPSFFTAVFVAVLAAGGCQNTGLPGELPADDTGPHHTHDTDDPDHIGDGPCDWDPGTEDVPGTNLDPTDLLFSHDEIPVFEITLSAEALQDLAQDPYEYTTCTFAYEDFVFENAGIRLKGQNSFQDMNGKPAFKIQFNEFVEDGRFYGLKNLTLNNMISDYGMMHERIAYKVYREAGVPAPRANHALVYVNGTYYGVYANIEAVDDIFLARWFEDPTGTLFEAWDVEYTPDYVEYFQLNEGEDDRENLLAFTQDMQLNGAQAWVAGAEHASMESWMRYWAGSAVVGQFDAYPYGGDDHHIYDDPTSGLIQFTPWGMDECYQNATYNVDTYADGLVATRCKSNQDCYAGWKAATWEMVTMTEEMDLLAIFDAAVEQMAPWIAMDTRRPYSTSMYYVEYYQDLERSMIANRRTNLISQIGPPAR